MSDNLIYSGLNIQYTITDDDINKALNHINTVEIQLINLLAIDIIPIKLNYIDYLDSNIPVVKDYAILIQDYNKLKDYSDNERIISSPANIKEYIDKLYKSSNSDHKSLKRDHESLKSDHESLKNEYKSLQSNHESLQRSYELFKSENELLSYKKFINILIQYSNNNFISDITNNKYASLIKLKVNFNASFETNYYHLKRTYPRIITAHKNCILTNINLFKILAYHFKLSYSEVSYIISTAVYSAKNINIVYITKFKADTDNTNFSRFLLQQLYNQRTIYEPIIDKSVFWRKAIRLWNNYTNNEQNDY